MGEVALTEVGTLEVDVAQVKVRKVDPLQVDTLNRGMKDNLELESPVNTPRELST